MKMFIQENKLFGKPEIIPLRVIKESEDYRSLRIHVICGGNKASQVLEELEAMGHQVTAGVVNQGSDDWTICDVLAIPMVEESPFTAISREKQEENLAVMAKSDLILISDLPFGHGNINNLIGLEKLTGELYFHRNCLNNDFTEGQLKKRLEAIKKEKTINEINDHQEFIKMVKALTLIEEK